MLVWFTWAMSVTALLSFILGHMFFFKVAAEPHPMINALKIGALSSIAFQWYGLWPSHQSTLVALQIAALLCEIIAIIIFVTNIRLNQRRRFEQAFNADAPATLYRDGLYRYVRHPFYSAYMTAYVGGVLGSGGNPLLVLQTLAMVCLYYKAASMEETKFINSSFKAAYASYQQEVGMFVPRLKKRTTWERDAS